MPKTPTAGPDATPEARQALGYNAMARLAGADCGRFVATARYLKNCGLAAPEVLAADVAQGFLVLEDLGDDLYTDVIATGGDERAMYQAAIEALARLHAKPAPPWLTPDKPLFLYDETAMLAEVDLLTEWFLPLALKRPADADLVDEHRALWRERIARHRWWACLRAPRFSCAEPPVAQRREGSGPRGHHRLSRMRLRARPPMTSSRCWKTHAATWRPSSPRR